MMSSERIHRIARQYAEARQRAADARNRGDMTGAAYAAAEAKRLRIALAEG